MPAIHTRRGNPRQGESENVDENTCLTLDPLADCNSRRGNAKQGKSENVDGNIRLALDPLV